MAIKYNEEFDSYYDNVKDEWTEELCSFKKCEFCNTKPIKPSQCK